MVLIGAISHKTLVRWRKRINVASHLGHIPLGLLLLAMGAMILTSLDHYLEGKLTQIMPDWLTVLETRF